MGSFPVQRLVIEPRWVIAKLNGKKINKKKRNRTDLADLLSSSFEQDDLHRESTAIFF